ncbi:MAG: glycogen synthase GlgA [Chloroflexi bacterium]|jgi:starch synthase|nr:glycogen synthase GlgA [Chloroflexota bacterium]
MGKSLNIMMAASECVPYAKSGGLADVVGALPAALKALGHNVIVVMPKYRSIDADKFNLEPYLAPMGVWMGDSEEWCGVQRTVAVGDVPVYFIEADKYFDRDGLYNDAANNDYLDNPRRFGFLSQAALQLCKDIGFKPDIVHAHDWQTALMPAYLKIWHWDDRMLGGAASMLTIHNIGYQGVADAAHYDYLGLQWGNFTADKFEDHGRVNFLKGGVQYADMVNTVSPKYAWETRTPEMAYGLAPYLNDKGDHYIGILNGVDYDDWNPAVDRLIPAQFTPQDLSGKKESKRALQARFLLEEDDTIPVMGVVSRLADQKGLDLLAEAIDNILANMSVQLVLLGSGDKALEQFFSDLPKRFPGRAGSYIGYNNEVAHWIEAGSDMFLMPSRYEPCGLNQIYSLKYGTLPVVRATGGLEDTVEQYDENTGTGTGFKFSEASAHAVYYSVGWAVSTYYDRREHWDAMVQQAMQQRFSWEDSARAYEKAYRQAIKNKQAL